MSTYVGEKAVKNDAFFVGGHHTSLEAHSDKATDHSEHYPGLDVDGTGRGELNIFVLFSPDEFFAEKNT